MWGAIIGDLSGSIFEYKQTKEISAIKVDQLISECSFYSDDSILTIAILDAIINDNNYEYYLRKYGKEYFEYKPNFLPYFKTSFSPGFLNWLNGKEDGNSIGNGAMMRISPIGYLFNSEKEVVDNVIKATKTSHNSKESIYAAKTVAMIIYLARKGYTKEDIISKLELNFSYKPFNYFNKTCDETLNNCLYALFSTNSFEDSIIKVISYGGDTDTNACIVGSMSEAIYGVNKALINQASKKIPKEFVKKLNIGYSKIDNRLIK